MADQEAVHEHLQPELRQRPHCVDLIDQQPARHHPFTRNVINPDPVPRARRICPQADRDIRLTLLNGRDQRGQMRGVHSQQIRIPEHQRVTCRCLNPDGDGPRLALVLGQFDQANALDPFDHLRRAIR